MSTSSVNSRIPVLQSVTNSKNSYSLSTKALILADDAANIIFGIATAVYAEDAALAGALAGGLLTGATMEISNLNVSEDEAIKSAKRSLFLTATLGLTILLGVHLKPSLKEDSFALGATEVAVGISLLASSARAGASIPRSMQRVSHFIMNRNSTNNV